MSHHGMVTAVAVRSHVSNSVTPAAYYLRMDSLLGRAHDMGLRIETGELPQGWWGAWNHRTRTIRLLPGLGAVQKRSTLAHELGHAIHNHTESTPETEAEARCTAARLLLTAEDFSAAAKDNNWLGVLARCLGVLPSDIAAFYESLTAEEFLSTKHLYAMAPRGF